MCGAAAATVNRDRIGELASACAAIAWRAGRSANGSKLPRKRGGKAAPTQTERKGAGTAYLVRSRPIRPRPRDAAD